MTRNTALEVFKGGWDQLEHATFTDNQETIPTTSTNTISFFIRPDGTEIFIINLDIGVIETLPID